MKCLLRYCSQKGWINTGNTYIKKQGRHTIRKQLYGNKVSLKFENKCGRKELRKQVVCA